MLLLGNTNPDKEGSLALDTCTGSERSDQAHISGQRGNNLIYFIIMYLFNSKGPFNCYVTQGGWGGVTENVTGVTGGWGGVQCSVT